MERVQTFVEKLQHQLEAHIPASEMLLTVQMLYAELLEQPPAAEAGPGQPFVMPALSVPEVKISSKTPAAVEEEQIADEDKIIEVLEVDENQIEAELTEIKKNAELKNNMSSNVRADLGTQDVLKQYDFSTQNQVKEEEKEDSVSSVSINDQLKPNNTELSEKLVDTPIKDLKKAIGVNDRYVFINELFKGDEAMYERSIKTINGFSIYPEAEYWIRRELKLKLGWKESVPVVKEFDQLVRRRFL